MTGYQNGIKLGSTMSNLTFTNVASVGNTDRGMTIGGGADLTTVTLDNVDFSENTGDGTDGIRASTGSNVDGLTIKNSSFDNNGDEDGSNAGSGIEVYQNESSPQNFTNVTIKNTTFNGNAAKGLYLEKLSNATIENVTISNSGTDSDYAFNAGIDLNLKFKDYSDITIKNSTFDNSGVHTTDSGGMDFAAALAIKARGSDDTDSGTYTDKPASLSGVTVKGNTFSFDNPGSDATAVRVGEPGSGAHPSDVTLRSNKLSDGQDVDVVVVSTSSGNFIADASANWWGTTDESAISSVTGGPVDVTPFLDSGTDSDGGTAGFQGDFSTLNVTGVGAQVGSTGRIDEGYNRVDGGGTVNVTAGRYRRADFDVQETTVLKSGADVSVSNTLTLTNGTLDVTNGTLTLVSSSETVATSIATGGNGSLTGDVSFERTLNKSDDKSHFRFLASPTTTALDDGGSSSNGENLLSNMWTQSVGSGADTQVSNEDNAFVFDLNEKANLNDTNPNLVNSWVDIENLDASINPGTGFLVYLTADRDPPAGDGPEGFPATLTATGPLQPEERNGNPVNPSITFTGGDGDGLANNGWNLIANPFMSPIDWESIVGDGLTNVDRTIYVWDPSANSGDGAFASYTAGGNPSGAGTQDRYIAPFQAFLVKANGSDPNIGGIDASDKATGESPEFKSEEPIPRVAVQLRAEEDTTGEATTFQFRKGAARDKDSYDAYQLRPFADEYTLIASEMDGPSALFDHQSRPMPSEADTIDLALDITEGGSYVLETKGTQHLPSEWKAILVNADSRTRWDLGAGEQASFRYDAPESTAQKSTSTVASMLEEGAPTVGKKDSDDGLPTFRLIVGPTATLPVELGTFDAETSGQEVHLRWETAAETNNAGFYVERRARRSGTWQRAGFIESKVTGGTTSEPTSYRFVDEEVPYAADTLRYRLRQIDVEGTAHVLREVAVRRTAKELALKAPFPNPASQEATIRYTLPSATDVRLAVHDLLGRRVKTLVQGQQSAGRRQVRLNATGLPSGTYLVRLVTGDRAETRKLTIVR